MHCRFKVIILDEVHERSVESDLVVACVKAHLNIVSYASVVLMSATLNNQVGLRSCYWLGHWVVAVRTIFQFAQFACLQISSATIGEVLVPTLLIPIRAQLLLCALPCARQQYPYSAPPVSCAV